MQGNTKYSKTGMNSLLAGVMALILAFMFHFNLLTLLVFGVAAIVLGGVSISKKEEPQGLAIAGIILGAIDVSIAAAVFALAAPAAFALF